MLVGSSSAPELVTGGRHARLPAVFEDAPPMKHSVVRVIEYDDPTDVPSIEHVPVALIHFLEPVACRDELLEREFAGRIKVDQLADLRLGAASILDDAS